MVRYKDSAGDIKEVEGVLSTHLFLDGIELFENDLVFWNYLDQKQQCKIIWSTVFNGWALIRTNGEEDEVPIGEYGISLSEISTK